MLQIMLHLFVMFYLMLIYGLLLAQVTITRIGMSVIGGPDNRFTLAVALSLPNASIISTLSVIAYSGFDGFNISCADGIGVIAEPRTSTASDLGKSSTHLC